MTREEVRRRDLERFQWHGNVHLDNVEQVAMAVDRLLRGTRFTAVHCNQVPGSWPAFDTYPSQRILRVEMIEGGDWIGFTVETPERAWSLITDVDGPAPGERLRARPGAPFAWFRRREGPSFRWSSGLAKDGFHLVLAPEEDRSLMGVWDVMDA